MNAVFVDLDGTLLNSDAKISDKNLNCLDELKDAGILIVAVTGRTLFSAFKVLSREMPFDFLIFSTGVGIYDFKKNEIVSSHCIDNTTSKQIVSFLKENKNNFFVQHKVPDNHYNYFNYSDFDSDFEKRLSYYGEFSVPLPENLSDLEPSQVIVFLPNNENEFQKLNNTLKAQFPQMSYVRATSPLNFTSIWLEIYPPKVNKGSAIVFLCSELNIPLTNTLSVGNDYNDLEMLETCNKSYVVANSPEVLKMKFENVASNDQDGFCEAISKSQILTQYI
jgi:hypothetical protein